MIRASVPGLLGLLCTFASLCLVSVEVGASPAPIVVPYAVTKLPETELARAGVLDLNRANALALQGLPGVGPATSAAIVADRERRGPFQSVASLQRVKGIGPAKLEAVRPFVYVSSPTESSSSGGQSAPEGYAGGLDE